MTHPERKYNLHFHSFFCTMTLRDWSQVSSSFDGINTASIGQIRLLYIRRMTMKKPVHLTLIVLFVFILGACATATPQSNDEMINPGDKIGDFLITTGNSEDIIY